MYYTCRYCGKVGVTTARARLREVCPARVCQLLRLRVNKLQARYGMTQAEAHAEAKAEGQAVYNGARSLAHMCPGCGERTTRRWCTECLCINVSAKGKRCGNGASTDGRCDYHAGELAASSRQW